MDKPSNRREHRKYL